MSSSKYRNGYGWRSWDNLLMSCGIAILLFITQSVEAVQEGLVSSDTTIGSQLEGKLEGPFRWLLHLGQNPADGFQSQYPPDPKSLKPYMGGPFMPSPGQIYDLVDRKWPPTTSTMLIWTPQYSPTGVFAENMPAGAFSHLYHIYIVSPEQRKVRLWFKAISYFKAWNDGQLLFDWRDSAPGGEGREDFLLHKGVNSMTFAWVAAGYEHLIPTLFSARITDCNDQDFPDLTFSLYPPLPSGVTYACRDLPESYQAGAMTDVSLSISIDPNDKSSDMAVIEYVPEGMSAANPGTGTVIGNTIQWSLSAKDANEVHLAYSLKVPGGKTGPMAFRGYVYSGKSLREINGQGVLFETEPSSTSDMAGRIQTIEIDATKYAAGENLVTEYLGGRTHYVGGMRVGYAGGWAEYEFAVVHPGKYHVILDYSEYWTMFHQSAVVNLSVDGTIKLTTSLLPTTHSYPDLGYTGCDGLDPERKPKWIAGSVDLAPGVHTLRFTFPSMYVADPPPADWDDGRPVIIRIIVTNYPGLTVPHLADPHHLDSYEHAPAMLAHDREVHDLPDGRVEMVFHSTFHSLSQGDEIYFVDSHVRPRVGQRETKFEVVSTDPEWFCIAPNGEQEFTLTVRSKEPVPGSYSELVMVWLQGVPDAPSRRLYLFSTCQDYIDLPPFRWSESPGTWGGLFPTVYIFSRLFTRDITDLADMFIPDQNDLGLDRGRYKQDLARFFQDQLRAGKLPSAQQILQEGGWDYANLGNNSTGLWSQILSSLYWRNNLGQAKAYIQRLSECMALYPVKTRWDWTYPISLPRLGADAEGVVALATHVRTAQENLVSDQEQFRILHNLVLPIFNSYYDALRVQATLSEDAHAGDQTLFISRPPYGRAGNLSDGFNGRGYIMIGDDLNQIMWAGPGGADFWLTKPLVKSYPKGMPVVPWNFYEDIELECTYLISLIAIGAASRDSAVVDEVMHVYSQILEKEKIFFADGSFRNEPGSYGHDAYLYPETLLTAEHVFGSDALKVISPEVMDRLHNWLINVCQFAFSNGGVPHLNNGGCLNQVGRAYCQESGLIGMLEQLFPEDRVNIDLYSRIFEQERNRHPGDVMDNVNFVIHGWGYAMLRGEGPWDRRMETLVSSKHLRSDPGDHVSRDCLGLVVCGLGTILTPRYGYSWVGYLPPFLNQVMVDDDAEGNDYYGSFWHFDGRKELPCAVAHVGDGNDCSTLNQNMSRWCIQFPEYLFDAYFVRAKDPNVHRYDWSLINMGELEIVEPQSPAWQPCPQFLSGYWPEPGTGGAGPRSIAAKGSGRVVADWHISNGPWVPEGDPTLLRYAAAHSGRLRLIAADDGPSDLIDAQVGYERQWNGEQSQANSQDILVIRKLAASHAFVDTLEPIADDEQPYVKDVTVVARGGHQQQLVRITTAEGEDWVYMSARWGSRPDGDSPVTGVKTDADIVAWRVKNGVVTRFYLANGSYASTSNGEWQFESIGNHYVGR